ncbi:MAG: RNase P subunit p30 family protein [Candidatus Aenigmatarchaeota archaeon]
MVASYWDYCVRAPQPPEELSKMAASLGWSGICILSEAAAQEKKSGGGPQVMFGILLQPGKPGQVADMVRKAGKSHAMVAVVGTSDDVNRAAAETPGIALLLPGAETKIDVIMARLARENGMRIAFEFAPLLHTSLADRGKAFSQMLKNAQAVRKERAPFVISSGAASAFGLRSPSELSALGRLLGFRDPQIRDALGPQLAMEGGKRLSGKWVMRGVEVEE